MQLIFQSAAKHGLVFLVLLLATVPLAQPARAATEDDVARVYLAVSRTIAASEENGATSLQQESRITIGPEWIPENWGSSPVTQVVTHNIAAQTAGEFGYVFDQQVSAFDGTTSRQQLTMGTQDDELFAPWFSTMLSTANDLDARVVARVGVADYVKGLPSEWIKVREANNIYSPVSGWAGRALDSVVLGNDVSRGERNALASEWLSGLGATLRNTEITSSSKSTKGGIDTYVFESNNYGYQDSWSNATIAVSIDSASGLVTAGEMTRTSRGFCLLRRANTSIPAKCDTSYTINAGISVLDYEADSPPPLVKIPSDAKIVDAFNYVKAMSQERSIDIARGVAMRLNKATPVTTKKILAAAPLAYQIAYNYGNGKGGSRLCSLLNGGNYPSHYPMDLYVGPEAGGLLIGVDMCGYQVYGSSEVIARKGKAIARPV